MSRIINGEAVEKHVITTYRFKSLDEEEDVKNEMPILEEESVVKEEKPNNTINEEILENLLKKIEELSTNIVTIRNDFENQLNECKIRAQEEQKRAFEEGYQKGVKETEAKFNQLMQEKLKLLEDSIKRIDESAKELNTKINSLEKELVAVALDIAKEVIQSEISKDSSKIALALAKSLMEEVKDASKIQIKVNPKDAEYLKLNLSNVEIIPDEAIKEGGVVIISDVGNIDAEIENRFKAIKEAVLEERE